MLILSVANVTSPQLTRDLHAAGIPCTVVASFGACQPWPIETGATALVHTSLTDRDGLRPKLEAFAARYCRERGEQCALLAEIPGTFDIIPASMEG